jgi:hypothetical protein
MLKHKKSKRDLRSGFENLGTGYNLAYRANMIAFATLYTPNGVTIDGIRFVRKGIGAHNSHPVCYHGPWWALNNQKVKTNIVKLPIWRTPSLEGNETSSTVKRGLYLASYGASVALF